ncbi:MAG TPA: glutathione peroxidase [Steroidobacteraceae bacterium]|jgi:glutathione peroxidase
MTSFYDFAVQGLDGSQDILTPLRGKVTLAVNVASKCGFTPQYAGLEELYQELRDQNFSVVGFPCNQFGAQEPGSAAEIQSFCSLTYGVSFKLAEKIDVNGPHRHPVYAWLTAKDNGFPGDIGWNFEKFLIARDGRLVCRYPSATKPTDPTFLQDLADVL